MKVAIFLLIATLAFASGEFYMKEEHKTAKPVMDHPRFKSLLQRLYPGLAQHRYRQRVFGGQPAALGQFPFQSLLFMFDPVVNGWYMCGGSFVTPNWVLSAAHCIWSFTIIDVFGGIVNNQVGPYEFYYAIEDQNDMISHEDYDDDAIRNDIGLLYMANAPSDLFNSPNIGPIALPRPGDENFSLVDRWIEISGFGRFDDQTSSDVLRFATAPGITNAACAAVFGQYILDSNLCIGTSHGASTCSGDSGGPNTYEIRAGEKTIVGITSFGAAAGCTLGFPAAFARVTYFLPWIQANLNRRS